MNVMQCRLRANAAELPRFDIRPCRILDEANAFPGSRSNASGSVRQAWCMCGPIGGIFALAQAGRTRSRKARRTWLLWSRHSRSAGVRGRCTRRKAVPDDQIASQIFHTVQQFIEDAEARMETQQGRVRLAAVRLRWRESVGGIPGASPGEVEVATEGTRGGEAPPLQRGKQEEESTTIASGSRPTAGDAHEGAAVTANDSFYAVFNARDVEAMGRLWAGGDAMCACVHPGKPRLVGRDLVCLSWERVLTASTCPTMTVLDPSILFSSQQGAVVICREEADGGGILEATNVFVCDADGSWFCVGHHATPVMGGRLAEGVSALAQGLNHVNPLFSGLNTDVTPTGVPVIVREPGPPRQKVPAFSELNDAERDVELEARAQIKEFFGSVESNAETQVACLRAQSLRLRWEALVEELDREAGCTEDPPSDEEIAEIKRKDELQAVEAAALEANRLFYRAFNERSVDAMGRLWADKQRSCECTHPGKTRLQGRQAVMTSWSSILASQELPEISVSNARVLLATSAGAVVVCTEEFASGGYVEATNTFARGDGGELYIVGHHAG